MFILGCPDLIVATDHKPLVRIFNDRELAQITNPRLLSLKQRSLMYNFKIKHVPGELHHGADATSRNPAVNLQDSEDHQTIEEDFVEGIATSLHAAIQDTIAI